MKQHLLFYFFAPPSLELLHRGTLCSSWKKSAFAIPDPKSVARESKFPECTFPDFTIADLGWAGMGWIVLGGVEHGQDSQKYIFVYFRSVFPEPHGKLGVLQGKTMVIRLEQS